MFLIIDCAPEFRINSESQIGISDRAVATRSGVRYGLPVPGAVSFGHRIRVYNYDNVQNSIDPSVLTASAVSARADALMPEYRACLADIVPEAGFGGIWESEMFLFYATVYPFAPTQVLESGRARGKSTLILARCFPKARIISVELNSQAPNAAAAEAKLKSYANVELVYGDSREVMARRLQNSDAVLIDGPKGFRALKLALQLLSSGKPCAVFVHDCPPGSPVRDFLVRHWPGAFFGDDPLFRRFQVLDEGRDPLEPSRKRGYGIFACLPAGKRVPFWWLRLRLLFAELISMGAAKRTVSPAADA